MLIECDGHRWLEVKEFDARIQVISLNQVMRTPTHSLRNSGVQLNPSSDIGQALLDQLDVITIFDQIQQFK